MIRKFNTTNSATRGYTSHIYTTTIPVPKGDAVTCWKTCGICDCKIEEPEEDDEDQRYSFEISNAVEVTLPRTEWLALWKKFKDTGYEVE